MISIQSIEQGFYTKADLNNQFVLHVSSSAKPGDTPFYKPWGMCHPKGVCFFCAVLVQNRLWEQQRCMNVLICRLDSKRIRKKRVSCKFEMDFKKSVGSPI